MSTASFRFHGELESFLTREHRGAAISHAYARAASMKQAIESLGVPHTEVGRITVNGHAGTLARTVRQNDVVEAFPHDPGEAPYEAPLAFVADAHMGGLARMLRMLGFDTAYDNGFDDPEVVTLAAEERRVVLTRDRELLKCRDVLRGCYVHALKPEAQLREVARRYAIAKHMQPFAVCLHCNLPLAGATREAVEAQVPDRIQQQYERFMHCPGCNRVYWEGSHWQRMREVLADALELPPSDI